MALPGVKAVPAAIKALDINHDGQADLLIFNEYGPPQLLLGKKGEPPRPFTGGLGPLTGATPVGRERDEPRRARPARRPEHLRAADRARRRRATGTSRTSTTPGATRP